MAISRPVFSPTPSSHSSFSLVDGTRSSDALSDDGFEVILAARSERSASITAQSDDDDDDDVLLVGRGTTVMSPTHLSFSSLTASAMQAEALAASVASLSVRDEVSTAPIIEEAPSTPAPVVSVVAPITPDPTPKKPKRSRTRVRTKHGSTKQQPAAAVTPKPAPVALAPVANTPSKKKAKKTVAPVVVAYPSPTATPAPSRPASVATVMTVTPRKSKAKKKKAISENKENVSPPPTTMHQNVLSATATILPVVDDLPDDESFGYSSYEAAIQRISNFLANPVANPSQATRLTLLQSLIIELGLCVPGSPLLPGSVTAAQKFLKSHAFINIRDYVTVRSQGLAALKAVMFPSQSALRRDLKQRRASLKWVKKHGLSPLLVQTHFI